MVREENPNQLSIEEFKTPFYRGLDKNNRWVLLAQALPWEEMTRIYTKSTQDIWSSGDPDAGCGWRPHHQA